jgi:hypothetical protein
MEITLDVCLFEGHNLSAKQMAKLEILSKVFPEDYVERQFAISRSWKGHRLPFCTISKARRGLSVPEHMVTTRKGFEPKCDKTSSKLSSSALLVMCS